MAFAASLKIAAVIVCPAYAVVNEMLPFPRAARTSLIFAVSRFQLAAVRYATAFPAWIYAASSLVHANSAICAFVSPDTVLDVFESVPALLTIQKYYVVPGSSPETVTGELPIDCDPMAV